jgi:hypothetical protein
MILASSVQSFDTVLLLFGLSWVCCKSCCLSQVSCFYHNVSDGQVGGVTPVLLLYPCSCNSSSALPVSPFRALTRVPEGGSGFCVMHRFRPLIIALPEYEVSNHLLLEYQ